MSQESLQLLGVFFSNFIAMAIPLILVAFGGMFSEHSGIINIALEGVMIIGAMAGSLIMRLFIPAGGSTNDCIINKQLAVFISVMGAGLAGALFSGLLGVAANRFNADQTIAGTALNIIAPAFFIILAWAIQGQGQTQVYFPDWYKIKAADLGITNLGSWPVFWKNFLFYRLSMMTTFFALVLIPLSAFVLYHTKFGLRLRSCGEHPEASASLGLHVHALRYAGTMIGGFLAGIGGMAYMLIVSINFAGSVAGYGFLALAVMIFGNWKPWRIVMAALFFSLFQTASFMYDSISWLPQFSNIQGGGALYQMVPYVITIVILAFTSKHSQAPKAEGLPYDVSRRS